MNCGVDGVVDGCLWLLRCGGINHLQQTLLLHAVAAGGGGLVVGDVVDIKFFVVMKPEGRLEDLHSQVRQLQLQRRRHHLVREVHVQRLPGNVAAVQSLPQRVQRIALGGTVDGLDQTAVHCVRKLVTTLLGSTVLLLWWLLSHNGARSGCR